MIMQPFKREFEGRNIPPSIKKHIFDKKYRVDEIGKSGSSVLCFDNMVLKIEKQSEEADNEMSMLKWLYGRLPVPEIIEFERNGGFNYLLMSRLEGEMACSETCLNKPEILLRALADGLKMLWNTDISFCPYMNNLDNKLRLARRRVEEGLCDTEDVEEGTYGPGGFKNPEELLQWLMDNMPEEHMVFSHGDYCLPNIFIKDGHINGFIDLGKSGAADIYQDIALCLRSLKSNYSGAYGGINRGAVKEDLFFKELDITPDWDKIRYYILLDELF
ncbi:MAG: aminoglycoside 3'-phosphotransferase [Christensenellaceae bacterium]|nr:aminoglycoside 3'-phosphotransferase [Christensenellaceae bacterium]